MTARAKRKPLLLKERDIERTCTDFLALDDWRCVKTDMPHLRGLGVQEKGMADRLYVRYAYPNWYSERYFEEYEKAKWAEVLWIEWKSQKGKARPEQLKWHKGERIKGALTWISGIDFPPTIQGFMDHYKQSGLNRRML